MKYAHKKVNLGLNEDHFLRFAVKFTGFVALLSPGMALLLFSSQFLRIRCGSV